MAATVDLTQALERACRALAHLEAQAAGFGALHIPTQLQIELEEKRQEVAELEARMNSSAAEPATPKSLFNCGQQVDTRIDVAGGYHEPPAQKICIPEDGNVTRTGKTGSGAAEAGAPIFDIHALRVRLQCLDDVEVDTLCIDYFPTVYDKFTRGLRRDEKLNLLLDYCQRNPREAQQLANLLEDHPTRAFLDVRIPVSSQIKIFEQFYIEREYFGGREDDLTQLDSWLKQQEKRIALLSAPAGLGKSALVAHWVAKLRQSGNVDVVYHPISLRFGTHQREDVLRSLVFQLVEVFNEEPPHALDGNSLQLKLADLLLNPPDLNRPILIVIDGLDELDTMPDKGIEFALPKTGFHLLITVRTAVEEIDGDIAYWRHGLKWGNSPVEYLQIDPLTESGVKGVILQAGLDISEGILTSLTKQVHHLSGGHPLLVNLYLQRLKDAEDVTAFLQRETQPGLGYFIKDTEDQLRRDEAYDENFLGLLSAALGPLYPEDLEGLNAQMSADELATISRNSRGLIIGDGRLQGFVFSHPMIGYAYAENHPGKMEDYKARFVQYGENTFQKLIRSEIRCSKVPPYVLRYYAKHLLRNGRSGTEKQLFLLVCKDWMKAHFAISGSYDSFLRDVQSIWQKAEERGRYQVYEETPSCNPSIAEILDIQLKCALSTASVAALASNLPPLLPALLVREQIGSWRISQAREFANAVPDIVQRMETKVSLLEMEGLGLTLPDQTELVTEILADLGRAVYSEEVRGRTLLRLYESDFALSQKQLEKALDIAWELPDPLWRVRGLAPLMSRFNSEDLRFKIVKAVILSCIEMEQGSQINNFRYFPYVYSEISANLPVHLLVRASAEAFENPRFQENTPYEFFSKLAWHISGEQAEGFIEAAYAHLSLTGVSTILSRLSPNLDDELALKLGEDLANRFSTTPSWKRQFWYQYWNGGIPAILILAMDRKDAASRHRLLELAEELIRKHGGEETALPESELWIFCDIASGKCSDKEIAELISRGKFLTRFFKESRFNLFSQEITGYLGSESIKALLQPITRVPEENHYLYFFIGESGYFLPTVAAKLSDREWPLIYEMGPGKNEYADLGYMRATAQNFNREGISSKIRREIVAWAILKSCVNPCAWDVWGEMLRAVAPYIEIDLFADREFVFWNWSQIQVMAPELSEPNRKRILQFGLPRAEWMGRSSRVPNSTTTKIIQYIEDENTRKTWLAKLLYRCMSIDDARQQESLLTDLAKSLKGSSRQRVLRERNRVLEKLGQQKEGLYRRDKGLAERLSSIPEIPVMIFQKISCLVEQIKLKRAAQSGGIEFTPYGVFLGPRRNLNDKNLAELRTQIQSLDEIPDDRTRQEKLLDIADFLSDFDGYPRNIFTVYVENVEKIWGKLKDRHVTDALEVLRNRTGFNHPHPYRILIPPILSNRPDLLPDLLEVLEDYPFADDEALTYAIVTYFLSGDEQLKVLQKVKEAFSRTPLDEIVWSLTGIADYIPAQFVSTFLSWLSEYPSLPPLVRLAPKLAGNNEHLDKAFQIALTLERQEPLHRFICALAPALDSKEIIRAVQLIVDRKMPDESRRGVFSSEIFDDTVIEEVDEPLVSYHCLRSACLELSDGSVYDTWSGILRVFSSQPRDRFLEHIRWWLPVIGKLGGSEALVGMAHTIVEISDWGWYLRD